MKRSASTAPDLDLAAGVVTVRDSKFGKSRELPLHPTTVTALREYLRIRDAHQHAAVSDALLISPAGTRLIYCNVHATFRQLRADAGLTRGRRRAVHAFTISATGSPCRRCWIGIATASSVPPRLPLLSTYMGHTHPRHTFWYLQAAPELMAIAGQRLEAAQEASHECARSDACKRSSPSG